MIDLSSNPYPLGLLVATPGVPTPIVSLLPEEDRDIQCNLILIQASPDNTGRCYVGNRDLNVAAGTGVICVLPSPGDFLVLSNIAQNVYRLRDFYVELEYPDDGVFVTIYVR